MKIKSLFPVLATTALVALGAPAFAEGTTADPAKGPNVNTAATGTKGAVATMAMAQDLYALGMANKDALTVLTAAKLAASVDVKEIERKKETKGDASRRSGRWRRCAGGCGGDDGLGQGTGR